MATDSISRLIFNALLLRENLNLPGIGSLRIVSEPARMHNGKILTPPSTQIRFSSVENPDFTHVIKLIEEKSRKTEQVSLENYQKWASKVYERDAIRIPSVGIIKDGLFIPAAELERMLNPTGTRPVRLQRQMGASHLLLWVAAALLAGGGLAAGLITLLNSRPDKYDAPYAETTSRPEIPVATPQKADTLTGGEEADTATADIVPTVPETASTAYTTAPKSGGIRYYVVVGTYSTDANAERFIASARRRDNTQNYQKLQLSNGKIMVYTAEAASEVEANRLRRAITVNFPDAWVHKRPTR